MGAVRMRVQTADKTSQYSTSNPHNTSPSINDLRSEKLHGCILLSLVKTLSHLNQERNMHKSITSGNSLKEFSEYVGGF